MSVQAMSWALSAPCSGNHKVVLLGLANHAHPDGSNAYPAVETLANYARVDRRTVQRALRSLEADRLIERDGTGPRGQQMYRLDMGRQFATPPVPVGGSTAALADDGGGADVIPQGGRGVLGGAAPAPPEPSVEPSKEPSDQRSAARADGPSPKFMEIWAREGPQVKATLARQSPAVVASVQAYLEREASRWAAPSLLPAVDKAIGHAKAAERNRRAQRRMGGYDPERGARIMAEFEAAQAVAQ